MHYYLYVRKTCLESHNSIAGPKGMLGAVMERGGAAGARFSGAGINFHALIPVEAFRQEGFALLVCQLMSGPRQPDNLFFHYEGEDGAIMVCIDTALAQGRNRRFPAQPERAVSCVRFPAKTALADFSFPQSRVKLP
ncbi:MAG: hypothetical protein V4634_12625 [Pseudomonadota bacterium]